MKKNIFLFQTNLKQVSTFIFQGLFKDIVFRSVALVMGYFWFFHRPDFFSAPTVPYKSKKNPLNYFSLKVTKFHGDSFKNESGQKTTRGRQPPPPSSLFRVKPWSHLNDGVELEKEE